MQSSLPRYATGKPTAVGRGIGRQLIATLVKEVRTHWPGCDLIVDPLAEDLASRRVLEHSGFELTKIRVIDGESRPSAIYRRTT